MSTFLIVTIVTIAYNCSYVQLLSSLLNLFIANIFFRSNASSEKRLISYLMQRYETMGKDGRPVKNVSSPVTVQFGLGLIKMELKEKENVLVMSTWSRMVSE